MDPKVAAILKWTIALLIGLLAFIPINKHFKKEGQIAGIAQEMQEITSEGNFYRPLTDRDARTAFLRAIALLERAQKLGVNPGQIFNRVFQREDGKAVDDGSFDGYPTRERLARESLTRGYLHAQQLGLLASPQDVATLAKGEIPSDGTRSVIVPLIDPTIAPGLEKVVPNFELRAYDNQAATRNDAEIAAARQLAGHLALAGVIDRQTEQRIQEHYRPKTP